MRSTYLTHLFAFDLFTLTVHVTYPKISCFDRRVGLTLIYGSYNRFS